MNVVLIGYRGTGKTSVARELSSILGMDVIGTDAEIVSKAGMSIPDIVAYTSWDRFRDLEETVVKEAAARDSVIIDCGGGVVLRPVNVELLGQNGVIFLLTAAPSEIAARIQGSKDRPSLTGNKSFLEEVEEVLAEREPLYRRAADYVIATSGRDFADIARQIAGQFRRAALELGR